MAGQTFAGCEFLAVDDGSVDATRSLLLAWREIDPRVRVLDSAGAGLIAALRLATDAARGEYIARMDADDIAEPDRFAKQVALLDARPEIVACGTLVRYFPREVVRDGARRYEQWINALAGPDEILRDLFVECPIPHPTLVVRAKALRSAGGYVDSGWPEDYDLVLRLWGAGGRFAKVPEVLLHWRESEGRASRTHTRYSAAAFVACKVHHLLERGVDGRPIVVWGAGPVGKSFARELLRQGGCLAAFVDLDPRRIGQTIHGAPVIAPGRIGEYRDAFTLAAVGSASARAEIRSALGAAGLVELRDFRAVA